MGSCGCGEGYGRWSFSGLPGQVFTFDVYPGCDGCDQPIGIIIQRIEGDNLDLIPDLVLPLHFSEFDTREEHGDFALPLIDPGTLLEDIVQELGEDARVLFTRDSDVATFEDALGNGVLRRALESNLKRMMKEWLESRAKNTSPETSG